MALSCLDLEQTLQRRYEYAQALGARPEYQAHELALCAADPVHWVNMWVWTYAPKDRVKDQLHLPFVMFPRQVEFFQWLKERESARRPDGAQGEDGIVEKSRDMGATWLCCAYALHAWLFRNGFSAGFGSRKLELVDDLGDLDTIFEKIRYALYSIPKWMLPKGFNRRKHDNFCKILNPDNGNALTGEGGDEIGRGGRQVMYFVDEAARLEHAQQANRALSQNTNCQIDVSTPNGMGNPFYQKRFSGVLPVFTFHWTHDPRKGQAWLDYQKNVKFASDPVGFASEVEIDYTASIEGICIPAKWVRAAVDLDLPLSGKPVCGLDIAEEGKDRSVHITRCGPVVLTVEDWGQCNTTETAWRARELTEKAGAVKLFFDAGGCGCIDGATLIDGVPVAERSLPARVRTLQGFSLSSPGFCKGIADLYQVRTRSGRSVTVTAAHRFLSLDGWLPLSRLAVGSLIAADGSENGSGDWGTPTDSPGRCSGRHCPCGEQSPHSPEAFADTAKLLDAQAYAGLGRYAVALARLSTVDSSGLVQPCPVAVWLRQLWQVACGWFRRMCDTALQVVLSIRRPRRARVARQCQYRDGTALSCHARREFRTVAESMTQSHGLGRIADSLAADCAARTMSGESLPSHAFSCGARGQSETPVPRDAWRELYLELSLGRCRNAWDAIQDISWVRKGEFYDLHVPIWHHYSAAGLWHHNSGVRGTLNTSETALKFQAIGVNSGESPSFTQWPDGYTSKEKFINLRAELWWMMRRRFEKTYEHEQGIQEWPAEERISIPDHPQLIAELSLPLVEHKDNGKLKIEGKDAMKKRGVKSPDFADSLVLAFHHGIIDLEAPPPSPAKPVGQWREMFSARRGGDNPDEDDRGRNQHAARKRRMFG